jgi:hypothetical protein
LFIIQKHEALNFISIAQLFLFVNINRLLSFIDMNVDNKQGGKGEQTVVGKSFMHSALYKHYKPTYFVILP